MSSEWQKIKFDEIIDTLTDYHANGSYEVLKKNVTLLDVPDYAVMIRTTNFENNMMLDSNLKYITEDAYNYLKKTKVFPDDIIMNKIANPGTSYYMPDLKRPVSLAMNLFLIRVNTNKAIPRFIYYYLRANEAYVKSFALGTVTQTITKQAVRDLEIYLPNILVQGKITNIISALENKIELNRKMNQTLESMASAIFKSWFVDFDPVHAKANCTDEAELENIAKELGISKAILDLFPSEFEESELGMIPKGWEVCKIMDKLEVVLGGTPSRSNESYWTNGTVAWINSGKVNEFRIIEASEVITEEAVKKSSTKLLPKKTTVLAITGATLGQVSLLEIDSCANQSVIGLPETGELNHSFVYPCICNAIKELISHQTGGAQQHINKGNVENYQIVVPSSTVLEKYVSLVKPLLEQISNICFENQALEKTRDTLLPKLLSGEIDVSELEI